MTSFATDVTGWLLIAAAAMLWVGWTLLPVRIGAFFHWDNFPRVRPRLHLWIWLFRVHLFGHLRVEEFLKDAREAVEALEAQTEEESSRQMQAAKQRARREKQERLESALKEYWKPPKAA